MFSKYIYIYNKNISMWPSWLSEFVITFKVTQKQAKKQKFQAQGLCPKENVEEISNIKDRLIYIN